MYQLHSRSAICFRISLQRSAVLYYFPLKGEMNTNLRTEKPFHCVVFDVVLAQNLRNPQPMI